MRVLISREDLERRVAEMAADIDRDYGQNLPTPGYDAMLQRTIGLTSADFNAPPDTPYFSTVPFTFPSLLTFEPR